MRLHLSRLKLQLSTPNIYCHTFAESILNFKRRFQKSDKADNASAIRASRSAGSAAIPTLQDTTSWSSRLMRRHHSSEAPFERSANPPPLGAPREAPPASAPTTDTQASGARSASQVNVEDLDESENSPAAQVNVGSSSRPSAPTTNAPAQDAGQEGPGPRTRRSALRPAPGASGMLAAGEVNVQSPAEPSVPNTDARASSAQDTNPESPASSTIYGTSRTSLASPHRVRLAALSAIPSRTRLSALPSPTASELEAQAASHPHLPPVQRRMNWLTEGVAIAVSMVFPVFISPQDFSQLHGFNLTSFLLTIRILLAYFVLLVLGAIFAGGFPKKAPSHVGCLFNYVLLLITAGGIREGEFTQYRVVL